MDADNVAARAVVLDERLRLLVVELEPAPDRFGRVVGPALERLRRRAAIEGRPDDTPEAIRRRLTLYHEETEPLVEYYRARGNVVGIHGDRSENEVFAEVQQAVEQAGAVA